MTNPMPEKAARARSASAATVLPVTSRKRCPSPPASAPRAPVPSRRPALVDPATLPPEYALIGEGTCMLPEIPDGANCAFSTVEKPQPGDLVALWYRPEKVPAGEPQVRLKRLAMAIQPFVRFPYREHPDSELRALVIVETTNPKRQFGVRCGDLLAIHRFIGLAESTREGWAQLQAPATSKT